MSRPLDELIARAKAAGARALEYLGEDWNEVVEAARSALLLQVTEPPTIRPLESEPRLSEGEDPSTGRLSAFRTTHRAVEEDATLRQGDRLLPEQQQALREMALALAEMDPYLCGLPQTRTEGQLAHRSAPRQGQGHRSYGELHQPDQPRGPGNPASCTRPAKGDLTSGLATAQDALTRLRRASSAPASGKTPARRLIPHGGGPADLPKSESASSRQVQPKPACGRLLPLRPRHLRLHAVTRVS